MLTDSERKHLTPPKRKKDGKAWWSDSQKVEAIKCWMLLGNLKQVGQELNIPYDTLKTWKSSKWWGEVVSDLRVESNIQLSRKLKNIAEKAMETTLERLENGDYFYDQKTGEMIRKPVPMREANKVAAAMLDAHLKLDKKPQEDADNKAVKDRLDELKQQFAQFANNFKRPKLDVVDVDFKETDDAVYDTGTPRLQERGGLGSQAQEWETPSGQGGEDTSQEEGGEDDR